MNIHSRVFRFMSLKFSLKCVSVFFWLPGREWWTFSRSEGWRWSHLCPALPTPAPSPSPGPADTLIVSTGPSSSPSLSEWSATFTPRNMKYHPPLATCEPFTFNILTFLDHAGLGLTHKLIINLPWCLHCPYSSCLTFSWHFSLSAWSIAGDMKWEINIQKGQLWCRGFEMCLFTFVMRIDIPKVKSIIRLCTQFQYFLGLFMCLCCYFFLRYVLHNI